MGLGLPKERGPN